MSITKDYLITHTSLTEEDLDGVDVEDFVSRYALTPERLEEYDPVMILDMYKSARESSPSTDYTYIYARADSTVSDADLSAVKIIIAEYHSGSYNDCLVIDREIGSVYYGLGFFLSACGESMRISSFLEEDAAFLEDALRKSGITSWRNEYNGTSEGTTGSFSWAIGIQLTDGRCFRYSGEGVLHSGTPETMRPLMEDLIDHFSSRNQGQELH